MKHYHRIIYLLLAGTLLLTAACNFRNQNNGANTPGQAGRYVETDITPPVDGRFKSFLTPDGTVVCYNAGLTTRYESNDRGVSWTESPGPGRNNDRYQGVSIGTLLPDGRILAYILNEGLVMIAPDGGDEQFPLAEIDEATEDGDFVTISLLQSLGNDRVLISYDIGGMVIQGSRPINSSSQGDPQGESAIDAVPAGRTQADGAESDSGRSPNDQAPGQQDPEPQEPGSRGPNSQSGYSMSSEMTRKTLLLELSTGRVIAELPIENAMAATSDNETLYHMDTQGNVKAFNLADGSPSNKFSVSLGVGGDSRSGFMPSFFDTGGNTLAVGSDGGLYALFNRNLLLCGENGDVDSILEGTAYSIGSPGSSAESVLSLSDGSIIVNMLDDMRTNRLLRYAWDENATVDPDKRLSVWSLEENAFVRAAIAELRKKNPDSYITYEVALSGDNAVSAVDAIKTLNTRLLSGSGPDVLILDGCPVDSYADKGMLLDLSGLVGTGGIYQNLLAPYVSDGKIMCLPTQFMMPALIGEEASLGNALTLDELVAIIVNGKDTSIGGPGFGPFTGIPEDERAEMYFEDLEELCNILWLSAAPAIVKDDRLNTDALWRYLEAIKAISDKYGLIDQGDENTMSMSVGFASGGQVTVLPGSLVRYTSQMTNYGAFAVSNLMLLQLMMDRDGSTLVPFPGLVPGAWRPSTVTGISADTSVPDFAVELLNTMLSTEVQRINYGAGLPVTRAGIEEQIIEINNNLIENERGMFDIDMDALIEKLQEPSVNDTTITDMMWGSVERLCMGKFDVGGAVKEIEQNVKNYLAERA